MKTIEEYAIELVTCGVETYVDNENDDEFEGTAADLQAACDLAIKIAHFIKKYPHTVLNLVGHGKGDL